jgi:hypothetical protein
MYVRCAYFEGSVDPANQAEFDGCALNELGPGIAKVPGCRDSRILFGREYQADAPPFYMMVEHYYDSLDTLKAALETDQVAVNRKAMERVMPLFKGRVTHINHEARIFPTQVDEA